MCVKVYHAAYYYIFNILIARNFYDSGAETIELKNFAADGWPLDAASGQTTALLGAMVSKERPLHCKTAERPFRAEPWRPWPESVALSLTDRLLKGKPNGFPLIFPFLCSI